MNNSVFYFSDGEEKNKTEKSVLYLVATPIGNIADISGRAVKVLSEVDFIAAEDTRNSGKLLSLLGISKPMVSYHEHNKRESGERIASRLAEGKSCALITDAGTPAISDPGNDLCILCAERGIKVTSVPGACAAIDALALSALPTRRFVFEGFLPVSGKERRERLEALSAEYRTSVVYEAPHRLKETLDDLYKALGDRKIALCRELTKLNEEIFRAPISEAIAYYNEHQPRGEYVIVIAPCEKKELDVPDSAGLALEVKALTDMGALPKDAMKTVAQRYNLPKNTVYRAVVENKGTL